MKKNHPNPLEPSEVEAIRDQLEKRSWALSALSEAAATLARANSTDLLIKEVCSAIATQGPYVLAWVGRAEDDPLKTVKIVGAAGSALNYITDIVVSWSEDASTGKGPAGTCIRTNKPSVVVDSEVDAGFAFWRERAKEFGIRSAVGCPIPDGITGVPYGSLFWSAID
jgi:hypothetical protein